MQPNLKTDTNIKLPMGFIVAGLIAFVAAQVILWVNSDDLLTGQFRIPEIWAFAHLLILGFTVMVAMGAMYQLVPVTFLTPIWNQTFGFIQMVVTILGIGLLTLLLGVKTNIAVIGGALTVIGILMFLFQMAKTIAKLEKKSTMSYVFKAALICFLLGITAGFFLTWNFAFGEFLPHLPLLLSHITFAAVGWFTLLIMSISYKLVPMFSLSHGFSMKWAKPSFYFYLAGLVITITSYWIDNHIVQVAGFFFLLLGFLLFALDIKEILAKRMKKKLDTPFTFSLFAIGNGAILHGLAVIASLFSLTVIWPWLVYLYIWSWIIFSIIGYLYKIVPFLWWTHKYSERVGKEEVPLLKDLINEKLSHWLYVLFMVSMLGIFICTSLQWGIGLFLFLGLQTITTVLYSLSIIQVLIK